MSDLLAVITSEDRDDELLAELQWRHPERVTVLVEGGSLEDESDTARARRYRLAALLHAIEQRTGAIVVGLAGDRDQLRGWRFDSIVGGPQPLTA
jgi:hypothetical protein